MKTRQLAVLGLALAPVVALTACGGGASGGAASGTLKIGVPYPQTGSYAQYGANFTNGVKLAVDELNKGGGITVDGSKVKVEAVYCDTQIDTAKAAACGRKLASQDGVPVMAIATSVETFPILAFNQAGRDPFLVISSSASNKLTTTGNKLATRYWFNTYQYMNAFAELVTEGLEERGRTGVKAAVMQSQDEFGQAWNDTFTAGWKKAGQQFVGDATYTTGATDFYPQLTALIKEKPDLMAIPGPCPQVAPIVDQARQLGYQGGFVFQLSCGPEEMASLVEPAVLVGSVFEGSAWDADGPKVQQFKDDFQSKFGKPAIVLNGSGYSEVMWAAAAAEKSGSTSDPAKIRDAMAGVLDDADWNLFGMTDMQETGEVTASVHPRFYDAAGKVDDFEGSK